MIDLLSSEMCDLVAGAWVTTKPVRRAGDERAGAVVARKP
jgi:hypothetical protein